MRYLVKNLIIAFLVFLSITGIFMLFYSPSEEPSELTLNGLVTAINNNEVDRITVKGDSLEILLMDGTEAVSQKETEASLSESLTNFGISSAQLEMVNIEYKGESGVAFWLKTLLPFLLPFLIIGLFLWFMLRQAQRGSSQAMMFGKTSARVFGPQGRKQDITFKDVANAVEAKEELKEVIDFLKTPQRFYKMGARIPRGIILVGAPGTGKTLLARAVSGEAKVPFFATSGSEFVEMFVGVGASRVRDLFAQAKKHAPSIIFIDEIDAVGRLRGAGLGGGNDEREQTLNQILSEMDGFERDNNVIVIAATNRPDVLDPALLRPGRFDRRVVVDSPDIKARKEILAIHAKGKPLARDVDLGGVAQRTPGFSGADLANLMNEAAILATRKRKPQISQNDILISIEKVVLGPERRSRVYSEKEKEIAAYHEAGHAIVSSFLPNADPVHKISIISRGSVGGYTLKIPDEERQFHSRKHFIDELAALLGGYAAEEFQFGDLTTGASDDLKKASELSRKMVMQYGMSKKFGPVVFGDREETVFLGRELSERRNFSENIAHEIDKEVSLFLHQALKVAKNIVRKKKRVLKKIANILIEKETIERKEFDKLIATA